MPQYRLLIFSDNRLVHAESLEANGHVEAIKACSRRNRFERVELSADEGRIAMLEPASSYPTPR